MQSIGPVFSADTQVQFIYQLKNFLCGSFNNLLKTFKILELLHGSSAFLVICDLSLVDSCRHLVPLESVCA
jgi:hypothetical protein